MKKPVFDRKQFRKFGFTVGGVFGFIGLWPALWRGGEPRLWAVTVAAALVLPAIVRPQSLAPVYRFWMALGNVLNFINTRIILGALFYGLITPMAIVIRFFGRDAMGRTFESEARTYRVPACQRPGTHMTRQF
jgi:hypothetical protein